MENIRDSQTENSDDTKIYHTIFNGGHPFQVKITKNHVSVYNQCQNIDDEIDDDIKYELEPIVDTDVKKIFIGKSPINEMTKISEGYDEDFDANTILLELGMKLYMYIGDESIFTFTTFSDITTYMSPVGGSGVPYPYAIDENNNYYLISEQVIIKCHTNINNDDPYSTYYDNHLITNDNGYTPPKYPKIKNFRNINNFTLGGKNYTMGYHPFPKENYERISKNFGEVCIITTDEKIHQLSVDQYVNIMESFGKEINVCPMENITFVFTNN